MDVQPPPEQPPISPSQYPEIPYRTPIETRENVRSLCIDGDIQKFRETLDSQFLSSRPGEFDICDFHAVMMEAVRRDNAQFVVELLHRGLPMDQSYALEATKLKAKNVLEALSQMGWDINKPISELTPPVLSLAVEDEEMTVWLLDHGADPNQQCAIDLTPLSYAVESAPISIIRLMLERGGDVRKGQLLHHAIERNSGVIEVLSLLIGKGASLNKTMYQDHFPSWRLYYFMSLGTPLHRAAELGKVDVVRYLIKQGADWTIKDANGRTAMECAEMLNQTEVVKVLWEVSQV